MMLSSFRRGLATQNVSAGANQLQTNLYESCFRGWANSSSWSSVPGALTSEEDRRHEQSQQQHLACASPITPRPSSSGSCHSCSSGTNSGASTSSSSVMHGHRRPHAWPLPMHAHAPASLHAAGSMQHPLLSRGRSSTLAASQQLPGASHIQQRQFFNLPSPQDFVRDFTDPYRRATSTFITANLLAYMATAWDRRLFMQLLQNNYLVAKGEWYRLITSSFLHGGIWHLLGNMLAINMLGPAMEEACGKPRFTFIYLASALSGSLATYYYGSWASLTMGSSGAIAGLFAGYVTFKLRNRAYVPFTSEDMSWVAQIVAINVVISMLMGGTVSHTSHLGGLIGGALATFLIGPRYVNRHGFVEDRPLLPIFPPKWR